MSEGQGDLLPPHPIEEPNDTGGEDTPTQTVAVSNTLPDRVAGKVASAEAAGEIPSIPEMKLEEAQTILQTIVDTHESSITEANLDRIGIYSAEQIRSAMRIVTQSILDENDSKPIDDPDEEPGWYTTKQKATGEVSLFLQPSTLEMMFARPEDFYDPLLHCIFPLKDPSEIPYGDEIIQFIDIRSTEREEGILGANKDSLEYINRNPSEAVDRYRNIIRGVRWMSANMLKWRDADIIMPEQLDGAPSLPSASLKALPPTKS